MVVYIDRLFFINAVVDYLLLLTTAQLMGLPLRRGRYIIVSVIGGLYGAAAVVFPLLGQWWAKCAVGLVIALIAYWRETERWRAMALFFLLSGAMAGAMLAVTLRTGQGSGTLYFATVGWRTLLLSAAGFYGLLTVLWIYPRGKAVTAEKDPDLIAGAAGVALCLGADFVKVNPPKPAGEDTRTPAEALAIATKASGRTGLVCAGGSTVDAETFLTQLYDQIHVGGACGNATGRNIHQRSLDEAVRLTKAISSITIADYEVADALAVFNGEKDFTL